MKNVIFLLIFFDINFFLQIIIEINKLFFLSKAKHFIKIIYPPKSILSVRSPPKNNL